MVGTSSSWLVDLVSARVHEAGGLAPPSPSAPSPTVEGQQVPSPFGPVLERAHHAPTTTTSGALREEEVTSQEEPLPMGSSEAIAGPYGSSQLPTMLQESHPVLCCIP